MQVQDKLGEVQMKLTMQFNKEDKRGYDVIIKRGGLANAGKLANFNRKVLVITDEGVPPQYAQSILKQCGEGHLMVVKQGEGSKSAETWQAVLAKMLEIGLLRNDAVAAVGGGVIGDLGGFAAAAYMRGIPFFQFPTTVLSQVDSSIGGKVGINFNGIKNIVGAFHQPSLVVVDPETLSTLSQRHYANGLAEALKTALIGDEQLFNLLENEDIKANIEKILYMCLCYKKGVVLRDETEQGERKLLNFGHTIGHGIESAGELSGLLHGECVALGILPMIESKALQKRTVAVMKKIGLPLKHEYPAKVVLKHLMHDKKRKGNKYTLVRVKKLGEGYLEDVSFEELRLLTESCCKQ